MEWQPIETAPRDGTEILVAAYYSSHDLWIRDIAAWSAKENGWCGHGIAWDQDKTKYLTHWMYLPDNPDQFVKHPNVSRETQEWD